MEMNEEAIAMLTKMVVEQFTQQLAEKARAFSVGLPPQVTASEALMAFADAIDSTNATLYPTDRKAS